MRTWLRRQYPDVFNPPESIDACKDTHKLAFNAGIIRIYQDMKVIWEKDNKPR